MNKIILEADTKLHDEELREWFDKLYKKVQTLNERTKRQTMQIRILEAEVKRLKK